MKLIAGNSNPQLAFDIAEIIDEPLANAEIKPFSDGETVILPRTDIDVVEDTMQLGVIDGSVSLQELIDGLNSLGVSPRDMIVILQSIKALGALQADIEVL